MIGFLAANWGTILVAVVLAAVVLGVIVNMLRERKKNGAAASCGSGCTGCPSAGMCHKK